MAKPPRSHQPPAHLPDPEGSPLELLHRRLTKINLQDPEAIRSVFLEPAMQEALAAATRSSPEAGVAIDPLGTQLQPSSPYRPYLLSNLALRNGQLRPLLEAAQAWITLCARPENDESARVTRYAIAVNVLKEDPLGTLPGAPEELQRELGLQLQHLQQRLTPLFDAWLSLPGSSALPSLKPPLEGGILALDASLAELLEKLGMSGREGADETRVLARERFGKYIRGGSLTELFALWLLRTDGYGAPFLRGLAFCLWFDVVRPRLERQGTAILLGNSIESVLRGQDHYAKMPKVVPPISWSWGATGVPAAMVIKGDHYTQAPRLIEEAALLPKSWALLPADHQRRTHQTALPVDTGQSTPPPPDAEPVEALALAVTSHQGYVMTTGAAKLALLLLASPEVRTGQLAKATLGELSALTRPDLKRIRARDHEATARSLDELRGLFVFLPDGTKVQVFDVQSPSTPQDATPDMLLHYGLTGTFVRTLAMANRGDLKGPRLTGHEYRGEFLINLTGAMRLPNNKPPLLRYYVRFASHWNASFTSGGAFDESKMQGRTLDDWAAIANALSPAVVEYLTVKRSQQNTFDRRSQLSIERRHARDDLTLLEKKYGLIRLEQQGDLWKPLPPEEYLEAWKHFRTHGGRFNQE